MTLEPATPARRVTPATLIAFLALVLAVGGGSAIALKGKNKVRSDDIKNGQVKTRDLATAAVDASRLAPGTLAAEADRRIADNPLTAADPCAAGETAVMCGFFDDGPTDGNWEHVGGPTGPVAFAKDPAGFVHLSGVATITSFQSTLRLFILPAGYRPAATRAFTASCWEGDAGDYGPCLVHVEPNGEVRWQDGTFPRFGLSLDGISFRASG